MVIPEQFMSSMRELLPDDYDRYAASFSMPANHGLRANTLKCKPDELKQLLPESLEAIPYVRNGFYYDEHLSPAKSPYYYAGLYYIQEPSAMLPADRLPIEEGDCVLDLCAAPGGKSTALLTKLNGTGYLVSNDISYSRCQALLKNLEYTGGNNYCVCAEDPKKLATVYNNTFDKILIDAPCSGEGMFRRDPSLIRDWESKGPGFYASIQAGILESAYQMLKPGGMMLYSTCTFSLVEDEDNVLTLLDHHKDLSLVMIPKSDGMSEGFQGLREVARVFPHRVKGEGHFLALLQKASDEPFEYRTGRLKTASYKALSQDTRLFLDTLGDDHEHTEYVIRDGMVLGLPGAGVELYRNNVRYLRTGLLYGELDRNGRFKPDTALALSLRSNQFPNCLHLPIDDDRVIRYLKGESISVENTSISKGIVMVCVDDYPLGFAKNTGNGLLKNMYRTGWRMQ